MSYNSKPGHCNNPNGRPARPEIQELREALAEAKKENGDKSFIRHFVEKAYKDNVVAIALAKKILPDLSETDLGDNAKEALKILFGVKTINEPDKGSDNTGSK